MSNIDNLAGLSDVMQNMCLEMGADCYFFAVGRYERVDGKLGIHSIGVGYDSAAGTDDAALMYVVSKHLARHIEAQAAKKEPVPADAGDADTPSLFATDEAPGPEVGK